MADEQLLGAHLRASDCANVDAGAQEIARLRSKVDNLEVALQASRTIGMAVGILMAQHKLTEGDAFALLVGASQHSGRKLRDISRDVVDTGDLTD